MVAEPVAYDYEASAGMPERFRAREAILEFRSPNYEPNNVPPNESLTALDTPQTVDVRRLFLALADEWHRDTGHLSSPPQIAMHRAYQRIIGMGQVAVPLILDDLRRRGGQWFWALAAITGTSPVKPGVNRNSQAVKSAWLEWGRKHGYIGD